jgi:hypothetical protein
VDAISRTFSPPFDSPLTPRFPIAMRNSEILTVLYRTDPAHARSGARAAGADPPHDLKAASTSGKPARFVAPHRARPASGAAPACSPGDRAAIRPPAQNLRAPAPGAVPAPAAPGA